MHKQAQIWSVSEMGVYAEQSSQVDLLENQDDQPLLPLEEGQEEQYTGDGSVDIHGRPSMRQNTGNWRACPFVLGNECCERLAYYGININLVTYLITKLHEGNADAAKNVNNWSGTCYLTPLLGAVLADAYWGRYWTIAVFSTIYFIIYGDAKQKECKFVQDRFKKKRRQKPCSNEKCRVKMKMRTIY